MNIFWHTTHVINLSFLEKTIFIGNVIFSLNSYHSIFVFVLWISLTSKGGSIFILNKTVFFRIEFSTIEFIYEKPKKPKFRLVLPFSLIVKKKANKYIVNSLPFPSRICWITHELAQIWRTFQRELFPP